MNFVSTPEWRCSWRWHAATSIVQTTWENHAFWPRKAAHAWRARHKSWYWRWAAPKEARRRLHIAGRPGYVVRWKDIGRQIRIEHAGHWPVSVWIGYQSRRRLRDHGLPVRRCLLTRLHPRHLLHALIQTWRPHRRSLKNLNWLDRPTVAVGATKLVFNEATLRRAHLSLGLTAFSRTEVRLSILELRYRG